ncbi:hypothetical protein J7337_011130 [Fusarium musae]|uniref:Uncharacterized protein n=1 Tax=Fusarium musae TaxID=1042133 RepID=A0A9P8DAA4_9HYPO|nr:hypothetical protein J7337_011130 [Fusarium musae]KAG9498234.1 hypothetical protein J7337_011130 [Fusarium musae]
MQTFIHQILGWADEVESYDQTGHEPYYWPSNSSAGGYETSNDSFYTASEADSEASTATIERSGILEPMASDVHNDTPHEETFEGANETANPHPYLTICTDIAKEAIYIYELRKEGVIDDTWNSKSCLLARTLIHNKATSTSGRLLWRCDVNYDPESAVTGDVVVLYMPDHDFVEKIEQGEVVFDQGVDTKQDSIPIPMIDPDFSGPEQRLAGRVLAWKVCGLGDCDWMDRRGRPIDLGDLEVIPNIIHLLK